MNNIDLLPDCYRKDDESNNYKFLQMNSLAVQELRDDMEMVRNILNLDNATGFTLDYYGKRVGQQRGLLNDDQYRCFIKMRIAMNVGGGNYNSTMRAIRMMFSVSGSTLDDNAIIMNDGGKCRVELAKAPLQVLIDTGFSSSQAISMIDKILPAGVVVDNVNFEGTFEFAENAATYDKNAGFADLNQTMGGYLGLLLGDDETIPVLPI